MTKINKDLDKELILAPSELIINPKNVEDVFT